MGAVGYAAPAVAKPAVVQQKDPSQTSLKKGGAKSATLPTDRKGLEKAMKKAPGDIAVRCALIGVMLTEGDTAAAEEQLAFALKLEQAGCLYVHRGQIAMSRGKYIDAAADCVQAVAAGLMPDEEAFIYRMDSMPPHLVSMRLKMAMQKDKGNAALPTGLGQLQLHRGDTAGAISAFREAYHRGDTTMQAMVDSLQRGGKAASYSSGLIHSLPPSGYSPYPRGRVESPVSGEELSQSEKIIGRIAFTRKGERMEVSCTINGLKIKAEVDTTAKESTISSVEAHFMLKNNYVSQESVINDNTLIIRETDFGDGLVLRGVRLHHRRAQEETVIFCLADLRQLGTVVIHEEKREIQIYLTQ